MKFNFEILRAQENHPAQLIQQLADTSPEPGVRWGVFAGLFGMQNNELYVVTSYPGESPGESSGDSLLVANPGQVHAESWTPTARPTSATPCSEDGLYVFRRFQVLAENVEQVVELSRQAWQTFENDTDYAARPMGLFCPPAGPESIVAMMLVTWYDGFGSWQTSRTPDAAARENFQQRHALTISTSAVATRLLH